MDSPRASLVAWPLTLLPQETHLPRQECATPLGRFPISALMHRGQQVSVALGAAPTNQDQTQFAADFVIKFAVEYVVKNAVNKAELVTSSARGRDVSKGYAL